MPIPAPHSSDKSPAAKRAFISRCMGDSVMNEDYPDNSQRAAICYKQWEDHKAKAAYVVRAGDDEFIVESKRKEPIDTDIEKREKTAGDPPKDAMPGLSNPNSGVNPDLSNAPSRNLPDRGSDNQQKKGNNQTPRSTDDRSAKPSLDDMEWYMGKYTLEPVLDEHTGLAKWPLSFKRIEKDTKRPNKPATPAQDVPKDKAKNEQSPRAV